MTQCNILKPFPFSRDGHTIEHASSEDNPDIPSALVAGLEASGFLEVKSMHDAPENKGAGGPVTIPENWCDLPWIPKNEGEPTLRSLAASLTDEKIRTKDDAVAAIELEVGRRASA